MDGFFSLDRLIITWSKKSGVVYAILSALVIEYGILVYFLTPETFFKEHNLIFSVLIPFLTTTLIFIIWYVSTNRIAFRGNKKFVLGVFLKVDELEAETTFKKIIKGVIDDVNEAHPEIKLVLAPINYKTSVVKIEEYLIKRGFSFDAILYANIESGNTKTEQGVEAKIVISEMSFIGRFDVHSKLNVFKSNLSLSRDLTIRQLNKNWNYIIDNSLPDKNKIKANFYDVATFYCGVYLVYLNEYDLALKLLKTLFNPADSNLKLEQGNKVTLNAQQLSAARLNNILLNLFMQAAINNYQNKGNLHQAYSILKECESMFNRHSDSYAHYLRLARFSYELGKLDDAKNYTELVEKTYGHTLDTLVNRAFFAILEDSINEIERIHRKIRVANYPKGYDFIDLVDFLENEKRKNPALKPTVDFCVASFFKNFINTNEGDNYLKEFIANYQGKGKYESLVLFAHELLNSSKPIVSSGAKKKKSKNKKKRNRKRR